MCVCVHICRYMHVCIIYNYTDAKRGKKIISNSWWIWAKHIWKYDVGKRNLLLWLWLQREDRGCSGRYMHQFTVPSCFLSSCCDVALLKDSLFFISVSIFPRGGTFLQKSSYACCWVMSWSSWRVFLGAGQVGSGQLWLTVGSGTLVAQVLGSTHWGELCWRPPFDTKTWPHLSCAFYLASVSALQIPPSGNSLRSEWM